MGDSVFGLIRAPGNIMLPWHNSMLNKNAEKKIDKRVERAKLQADRFKNMVTAGAALKRDWKRLSKQPGWNSGTSMQKCLLRYLIELAAS